MVTFGQIFGQNRSNKDLKIRKTRKIKILGLSASPPLVQTVWTNKSADFSQKFDRDADLLQIFVNMSVVYAFQAVYNKRLVVFNMG